MDRKWWTLVAVCTGVFMLLLDITIVTVALPDIQRSLGASLSDLQWVIDAYALSLAALLLTAGSIADRAGRRVVFATGIVVFTAGSALCGAAGDPALLAVSRALQGIGGAIMFATSLALLANAFHGRDRGTAFGVFGAVTGIAVAVGPVLGGAITSGLSWRWIFFVNIPIGIAALAVTLLKVDESRDPQARRIDYAGFTTFSAGLAALVYGLIRSNEDGWGSTTVIGALAVAAVLLTAFVIVERVQREPMFDLSLVKVPTFVGGLTSAFGISASLFSLLTYIVLYIQNLLGYSAVEAGVRVLPLTGAIFLTAGIAGRLSARVPTRLLIGPGFVLIGIGLLLMHGLTPSDDWTALLAGMVVAGVGAGLVNVPLASTAVAVVEPARAGMASGVNSTFRQVGIATGIAALGAIFSHSVGAAATPQAFVDGLNNILVVGAVVAFVSAVAAFALIRQRDYVVAPTSSSTTTSGGASSRSGRPLVPSPEVT
ncbi:MAG TPA: MFS transporter [Solirubrobacteraceae bacterium]|jgi:EmrB/QacA subfamily drug resistance transporter